MKDNDYYRMLNLKRKLKDLKDRKVKFVIWKLTTSQKEYIEEELGYEVIPNLYEVRTRPFKNIANLRNYKLKDLHFANKQGKKTVVLSLKDSDMKEFQENNIKFKPVKFKIILIS